MTEKLFILTPRIRTVLTKRGHDFICARCGKNIKNGDKVVSKGLPRKHYHKSCYESMWY